MSEEKSSKSRLTAEQFAEQVRIIEQIKNLTSQIKDLSEQFIPVSVKTAYQNSVKNLEKKNEIYSAERVSKAMTPEQKEQVKLFLAGKAKIVPTDTETEVLPISETVMEGKKKGKKGNN